MEYCNMSASSSGVNFQTLTHFTQWFSWRWIVLHQADSIQVLSPPSFRSRSRTPLVSIQKKNILSRYILCTNITTKLPRLSKYIQISWFSSRLYKFLIVLWLNYFKQETLDRECPKNHAISVESFLILNEIVFSTPLSTSPNVSRE